MPRYPVLREKTTSPVIILGFRTIIGTRWLRVPADYIGRIPHLVF